MPPFEELLAWQEVGQRPHTARPKQGGDWGPANSYTFQTSVRGVQQISNLEL